MELENKVPKDPEEQIQENSENVQQEAELSESIEEVTEVESSSHEEVESIEEVVTEPEMEEIAQSNEMEEALGEQPEAQSNDSEVPAPNENIQTQTEAEPSASSEDVPKVEITPSEQQEPEGEEAQEVANSETEDVVESDASQEPVVEQPTQETSESEVIDPVVEATQDASEEAKEVGEKEEVANTEDSEKGEPVKEKKEEEPEPEEVDFHEFEKGELVKFVVQLNKDHNFKALDLHLKPMKARYDELFIKERQEALDKFVSEGNDRSDFDFRDEEFQRFLEYYNLLREKRSQYHQELDKQKEENLKKKEQVLVEIRELIENEETSTSIKSLRELQDKWKAIGPVPGQHNKTLWANYNALLDRFYDNRSIYFELKELDRKKNLTSKLELCTKAEALDTLENIKEAISQLNELHEEFKHIGPIPKEQQEEVWQRFKTASDKIYVKRKEFVKELKSSLNENLDKKKELGETVQAFVDFNSDRITDWNKKTQEILEIQRKWDAVGGVPREKAKEVNKRFWKAFKQFFANKSEFFKKFEAKRDENLELKKKLIEEANELKESHDWNKTAEAFKNLQRRWKEVGPVPEKFRNSIYEEFKAACDHFFNQRREQNKEQNKEFEENLKVKLQVCDSIEAHCANGAINLEEVYDLIDQYMDTGFVPRNAIKKIQSRFDQVTKQLINSELLSDEDREDLKINISVNRIKGGPHGDRKQHRKENTLRRRIGNLENDINTWKTNLDFFAASKKADELKREFEEKIESASKELQGLKKELRMLRN